MQIEQRLTTRLTPPSGRDLLRLTSARAFLDLRAHAAGAVARLGVWDIGRFDSMPPTRGMVGDIRAMAPYPGFSVDHVHDVRPARDIVGELVDV